LDDHLTPALSPLRGGEGEVFAAVLKLRVPVFAGQPPAKEETYAFCSFSPGEKVRMRADVK